ncbi:MAG: hypothetical protein QM758_05600 [Armatimonas sp.]
MQLGFPISPGGVLLKAVEAEQAGISRRYGGISYEAADLEGRKMGCTVGGPVWDKAQAYIHGTLEG